RGLPQGTEDAGQYRIERVLIGIVFSLIHALVSLPGAASASDVTSLPSVTTAASTSADHALL
ncbi:hypothetical protein SB763_36425, partial [Burkholderia sp. SIMBA_042]|uniref:hypothetical protein n=1 Tax=Burkholderia sp. SIMBA_042 TaxID=3085783 RepID=UPI00397C926F